MKTNIINALSPEMREMLRLAWLEAMQTAETQLTFQQWLEVNFHRSRKTTAMSV